MRLRRVLGYCLALVVVIVLLEEHGSVLAQELIPIGQIQGRGAESDYLDRVVRFRGIVTGILEDENASGTRFYTVFVQDVPGSDDGDPETSDGLAIFVGARRPALATGDIAVFSGLVTEFYGLTELDNNGLSFYIESRNNPIPEPAPLDPPANNSDSAAYLERFEGMVVSLTPAMVVGPSHVGCGFSVVRSKAEFERPFATRAGDPSGQIVGALHPSDVSCEAMPAVAFGDQVEELAGPLTYHFDKFKIVYQDPSVLLLSPAKFSEPASPPELEDDQLLITTFNVSNYFDGHDDTGERAEPKPAVAEVALKQAKLAATIGQGLNCPTMVGLQEVENEALVTQLAWRLVDYCGFQYQVSHLESPDARGSDLALLTEPGRVTVDKVQLRQACTSVETEVEDPQTACSEGERPLFSRPPLQVDLRAGDQTYVILVNHFKSKRGGADETAERRLAQAEHIRMVTAEIYGSRPESHVVVLGDFNDYDDSDIMRTLLAEELLVDGLAGAPAETRYSYIFDGLSQLIDWILVSPSLREKIVDAGVLHTNSDLPFQAGESGDSQLLAFRSSDHDVPYIVIDPSPEIEPTATVPAPTATPSATPEPMATVETPEPTQTVDARPGETSPSARPSASPVVRPTQVAAVATPTPVQGDADNSGILNAVSLAIASLFLLGTVVLLMVTVISRRKK